MNINKKIEEIRMQPEHIRMRWVWGAVGISMFFIFIVWLFSLQALFAQNNELEQTDNSQLNEMFSKVKETAPSLKDIPLSGQGIGASSEGVEQQTEQAKESFPQDLEAERESRQTNENNF